MTDEKYEAPLEIFPKEGTSASGTEKAYSVEARLAYCRPEVIAGQLLDLRWTRISFQPSSPGIPLREGLFPSFQMLGLLSYQAAQALRWWFIAEAAREHKHLCVETRLIEHKVQYSYSETSERACASVGANEDRSHMYPPKAALTPCQHSEAKT